jgi:reverse gyrase
MGVRLRYETLINHGYFRFSCALCGGEIYEKIGDWKIGRICFECLSSKKKWGYLTGIDEFEDVTLRENIRPLDRVSVTRFCEFCGKELPDKSKKNMKTCNKNCRKSLSRMNKGKGKGNNGL